MNRKSKLILAIALITNENLAAQLVETPAIEHTIFQQLTAYQLQNQSQIEQHKLIDDVFPNSSLYNSALSHGIERPNSLRVDGETMVINAGSTQYHPPSAPVNFADGRASQEGQHWQQLGRIGPTQGTPGTQSDWEFKVAPDTVTTGQKLQSLDQQPQVAGSLKRLEVADEHATVVEQAPTTAATGRYAGATQSPRISKTAENRSISRRAAVRPTSQRRANAGVWWAFPLSLLLPLLGWFVWKLLNGSNRHSDCEVSEVSKSASERNRTATAHQTLLDEHSSSKAVTNRPEEYSVEKHGANSAVDAAAKTSTGAAESAEPTPTEPGLAADCKTKTCVSPGRAATRDSSFQGKHRQERQKNSDTQVALDVEPVQSESIATNHSQDALVQDEVDYYAEPDDQQSRVGFAAGINESRNSASLAINSLQRTFTEKFEGAASTREEIQDLEVRNKSFNPTTDDVVPKLESNVNHPPQRDDFSRINGISSTEQRVLNDAGYLQFSDLANANEKDIERVFAMAKVNFATADAKDWIRKASIACSANFPSVKINNSASTAGDQDSGSLDDLTKIVGIGTATAAVLCDSGIDTFRKLYYISPERLRKIFADVGQSSLVDSSRWTEQAAFAMNGDWNGLAAWQSENAEQEPPKRGLDFGSMEPDDLTRIKGIGPATQKVLVKNGIARFEQIAAMNPEQLTKIFSNLQRQFQMLDQKTWPAQAQQLISERRRQQSTDDANAEGLLDEIQSISEMNSTRLQDNTSPQPTPAAT